MNRAVSWLNLLGSSSTLICCAIPSLLVSIGAGASLVSLLGYFPQIIWLSEHKLWLFGFSASMLLLNGLIMWRARDQSCPLDPTLNSACRETRSWSVPVYFISLSLFMVGFLMSFVLPSLI